MWRSDFGHSITFVTGGETVAVFGLGGVGRGGHRAGEHPGDSAEHLALLHVRLVAEENTDASRETLVKGHRGSVPAGS